MNSFYCTCVCVCVCVCVCAGQEEHVTIAPTESAEQQQTQEDEEGEEEKEDEGEKEQVIIEKVKRKTFPGGTAQGLRIRSKPAFSGPSIGLLNPGSNLSYTEEVGM